jgi:hypothetical protein
VFVDWNDRPSSLKFQVLNSIGRGLQENDLPSGSTCQVLKVSDRPFDSICQVLKASDRPSNSTCHHALITLAKDNRSTTDLIIAF